jgi:hypothetical protein
MNQPLTHSQTQPLVLPRCFIIDDSFIIGDYLLGKQLEHVDIYFKGNSTRAHFGLNATYTKDETKGIFSQNVTCHGNNNFQVNFVFFHANAYAPYTYKKMGDLDFIRYVFSTLPADQRVVFCEQSPSLVATEDDLELYFSND